jgi:hypothetical protein
MIDYKALGITEEERKDIPLYILEAKQKELREFRSDLDDGQFLEWSHKEIFEDYTLEQKQLVIKLHKRTITHEEYIQFYVSVFGENAQILYTEWMCLDWGVKNNFEFLVVSDNEDKDNK